MIAGLYPGMFIAELRKNYLTGKALNEKRLANGEPIEKGLVGRLVDKGRTILDFLGPTYNKVP